MISFWIVAGALAAIFWVNWYFLFGQKPVARATAVDGGDIQEVRITVQGGYTRAVATVSKGKPAASMLRGMASRDPPTVRNRQHPLLFPAGETACGKAILDGQHPHDFIMEFGAHYSRPVGKKALVYFYYAAAGDAAPGPVGFRHRALVRTRHWAAWTAAQVSALRIESPETTHPREVIRTTASLQYRKKGWSSTIVWGQNHEVFRYLVADVPIGRKNRISGRFEWSQRDELFEGDEPPHRSRTVGEGWCARVWRRILHRRVHPRTGIRERDAHRRRIQLHSLFAGLRVETLLRVEARRRVGPLPFSPGLGE